MTFSSSDYFYVSLHLLLSQAPLLKVPLLAPPPPLPPRYISLHHWVQAAMMAKMRQQQAHFTDQAPPARPDETDSQVSTCRSAALYIQLL